MKSILVVLLLLVYSCKENSHPPSDPGKPLFEKHCKLCHGSDGKLGLNGSKDLTVSPLSVDERIALITDGKGMMVPYGGILSADEINAVAVYTTKLGK